MKSQEIESVYNSKKYKKLDKDFIKTIFEINKNKSDSIKATKQMLHEISGMYFNLDRNEELGNIWRFVCENISDIKIKKVLDLGCGYSYLFFKQDKALDYIGVDVINDNNILTDNILSPRKDWKNKNYDVTLMLNVIPVIERIEKGSGKRLIEEMKKHTKYLVIGFPNRSISGRKSIGAYWRNYVNSEIGKVLYEYTGMDHAIIIKGDL